MKFSPANISVLVCTHNPRQDYLTRAINALREQTLSLDQWETIVIDNGSAPPVAVDLSWHPRGRLMREETIGLTYARMSAIGQASANLLVFVDDDNLLSRDYLERAIEIAREWPNLGAWGGRYKPEFESEPSEWAREWWTPLDLEKDLWSNLPEPCAATPCGAGMCVRRRVAEAYVTRLKKDRMRCVLGHTGTRPLGADDHDLCLTACDLGLGTGVFVALKLTHLIPSRRLEDAYLLALVEGMTYSDVLLGYFRGKRPYRPSRSQRLLSWYQSFWVPEHERKFDAAKRRGKEAAISEIEKSKV